MPSAKPTAIIDVVGLSAVHIGPRMPFLASWASDRAVRPIQPVLPAVTTTAQSTYLTGVHPQRHGIVGNGWYFKDECEVRFWRQSNKLVEAPKVWDLARARDPSLTVANCFWWYAMYADVDYTVTPRPQYHSDGLKLPDVYTKPARLREHLKAMLGEFPLFNFWGPNTSIDSSAWIANSAIEIYEAFSPTLNLVYLPHLDYNLQRHGEGHPSVHSDLLEVDAILSELIPFYERRGVEVLVLSEYGITNVRRPIHLNRILRKAGLLAVREESGRELLDAGASDAFAVADHQVAHVYINNPRVAQRVRHLVTRAAGVEMVLDESGKREHRIDHDRAGDLVAVADAESWFTYYYWLDDARAPDFARSVDIHRKPGYDPAEMFLDPSAPLLKVRAALTLLRKRLGFRYRMEVVPLDASLVKGSHGRLNEDPQRGAVLVSRHAPERQIRPTDICPLILRSLFRETRSSLSLRGA